MKNTLAFLILNFLMVQNVGATITKELINFNNQDTFLLLKFSGKSKQSYRFLSRQLVSSGLRDLVGGCRDEEVTIDRFGTIAVREICCLSFKAPKSGLGLDNIDQLQYIDLGKLVPKQNAADFIGLLNESIGTKSPVLLTAGSVSTRGARSCTVINANPSCGTRRIPAVVGLEGFEKRPALSNASKRVVCTFNNENNPARFFEPETCLLNLSNETDLSEKEIIKRYSVGTRVMLLSQVECSTKTNRTAGGSRQTALYPNRQQTFISNIGQYAFEHGFDREFFNVEISNEVEDLGVFCEVLKVSQLKRPSGYEKARYKNVIACDTSRLDKRTFVYRIAKFDSKSCNFPLSQL